MPTIAGTTAKPFAACAGNSWCCAQSIIAIDGSKFKAVNNRDRNFTQGKIKARMQHIEQSIDRYLAAMDSADRAAPEVAEASKQPQVALRSSTAVGWLKDVTESFTAGLIGMASMLCLATVLTVVLSLMVKQKA
jgi:hypothetical protein